MADNNRNKPNQPKKPPEDKTQSSSSTENKDPQNQPNPSIASRIQNSASGLARNAFYTPGTPQDLAHSLPGGSKAGPASSGALFDRSASQPVADQYRQSAASSASAREHGAGVPGESFRSSTTQGSDIPSATEEFQHTYDGTYDSFQDSTEAGIGKGKGKARDTELELTTPASDYDQTPSNFDTAWQRITHTQPPDGTAVVSLLSDQTFNPDFPPSENEAFEPIETDLSTQTLTPEEVKMLDLFRRHLPLEQQQQQHHQSPQSQSRLNHSSLIPDISSFLDTVPTSGSTDATALRDDVLTSLPGSADWMAVEERYHDEVWGYLRPALEAAAREMEENRNTDTGSRGAEDGPAVQRLKMILRHMQG